MTASSNKENPARRKLIKRNIAARPISRILTGIALGVLGLFLISYALVNLFTLRQDYKTARDEYDGLRETFTHRTTETSQSSDISSGEDDTTFGEDETHDSFNISGLSDLPGINSDYIGWITIKDVLDYPIVQGTDNEKYIKLTFSGETNPAGTIFMDYRASEGFDSAVTILYGHNMRDGSMFGALHRYANMSYMKENPYIDIVTHAGETLTYQIFDAKYTDVWNPVYQASEITAEEAGGLFPNAPQGSGNYLVLSTCLQSSREEVRFLVFAVLI